MTKLIADAALATGLSLAAVTFVAFGGPDENYFKWAGPLTFICTGLLFTAYMGIRNYQKMKRLVYLYACVTGSGISIFSDTKLLVEDARLSSEFDPILHALMFQYNALNLFTYFVEILGDEGK